MAGSFQKKADEVCLAVNKQCKNADGFYTESIDNKQVSQITNILAILAGAVEGDEAKKLMRTILEPKDWFGQVDLFLHLYLFEAMNKTGLTEGFSMEISEWELMKERGLTTFVEVPLEWGEENQRSECHPWSSSPNYFFFRIICGIRPITPGHKTIEIAPSFGDLTRLEAVYPHHLGDVSLNITRNGSEISGDITIPAGIKATLIWNNRKTALKPGKQSIVL